MPTRPLRVRAATERDVSPLTAMMRLFHADSGVRLDRERVGSALATLARDPRVGRVLLADAGDEPLGYALVTFGFEIALGGHTAILNELYVRSTARRRGLGGLLLAEAERVALAGHARHLLVAIAPENERAFALLRARDFEPAARVPLVKDLTTGGGDDAR